jgi:hypothetical protein
MVEVEPTVNIGFDGTVVGIASNPQLFVAHSNKFANAVDACKSALVASRFKRSDIMEVHLGYSVQINSCDLHSPLVHRRKSVMAVVVAILRSICEDDVPKVVFVFSELEKVTVVVFETNSVGLSVLKVTTDRCGVLAFGFGIDVLICSAGVDGVVNETVSTGSFVNSCPPSVSSSPLPDASPLSSK